MPSILLYGNPSQESHLDDLRSFIRSLSTTLGHGCIYADRDYLPFLRAVAPEEARDIAPIADTLPEALLAISIGGDGTFLTTANLIAGSSIPVMGINAGHLGYLSATDIAHASYLVDKIAAGDFTTSPRTLISVESDSSLPARPFALNEVAFLKLDTASMITVHTAINGRQLASYSGDGLLISTPTGSTGYNLSVGGPIISPRSADWAISPIAPHSLSMRPLVVPDSVELTITASARAGSMLLAIDGRSTPLPIDTRFTLRKAPFAINVAYFEGHTFIDTLRHKLHWGAE